jgi:predicted RNase H-like HicB family nuclease
MKNKGISNGGSMEPVIIYLQHSRPDLWMAISPSLPDQVSEAETLEGAIAPMKQALETYVCRNLGTAYNGQEIEVVYYSLPRNR